MKNWIVFLSLIIMNIPLYSQAVNIGELVNFEKYAIANEKVIDSPNNGNRVVFMGNSITEAWPLRSPDFWKNKDFICRGISGQVSAQMLLRFRSDVIDLEPRVVVILAGTNDIAENSGYISLEKITDNIKSMAEMAEYHGIKVILCSVLPAIDFPWRPGLDPADKIIALNTMLKSYAIKKGYPWVDYYGEMVDMEKGLKVVAIRHPMPYGDDLGHPNATGYQIMENLVEQALEKVMNN